MVELPKVVSVKQSLQINPQSDSSLDLFFHALEHHFEEADEYDYDKTGLYPLLHWPFPPEEPIPYKRAVELALLEPTLEGCKSVLQRASSKRGRPATARPVAVKALVLKILFPYSWQRITTLLCSCGAKTHGKSCFDRLRAEVAHLERLIRRCGVDLRRTIKEMGG